MNRKINIAVDGYSSCGKGTLAKFLAGELHYVFIDSGAMYRAVTLAIIRKSIPLDNIEALNSLLKEVQIGFIRSGTNCQTVLNGEVVEEQIRSMEVSNLVSPVSKINEVRTFLVQQQKSLGIEKGVVMDGRDIGTVVFPDAELKLFMTARPEVRAMRRYNELLSLGNSNVQYEDVLRNINERDYQDSTRENSPLRKADDAIVIDNSELTKSEQNSLALQLALERLGKL